MSGVYEDNPTAKSSEKTKSTEKSNVWYVRQKNMAGQSHKTRCTEDSFN